MIKSAYQRIFVAAKSFKIDASPIDVDSIVVPVNIPDTNSKSVRIDQESSGLIFELHVNSIKIADLIIHSSRPPKPRRVDTEQATLSRSTSDLISILIDETNVD